MGVNKTLKQGHLKMAKTGYKAGKHFLQIPGPSNVPDRILRAMDYPTIDHRGPDFAKIGAECLSGIQTIFCLPSLNSPGL